MLIRRFSSSLLPALCLGCSVLAGPALAAPMACPDLAQAIQVAPCPSEADLRYTYNGYCSDNARIYDREADGVTCTSFEHYRKLKNIALWESKDGEFHAYLSCDRSPETVKSARPQQVMVSRKGKMTRLQCDYGNELVFTHRTHAECRVTGDAQCTTDPASCRAECEQP